MNSSEQEKDQPNTPDSNLSLFDQDSDLQGRDFWPEEEKKETGFFRQTRFDRQEISWGPLAALSVTLVALLVTAVLVGLLAAIFGWTDNGGLDQLPLALFPFLMAGPFIFLPLGFVLWREKNLGRALNKLGLRKISLKELFQVVSILLVFILLAQMIVGLFAQGSQEVTEELKTEASLLSFFAVCLLVPFYEEFLMRGFLFAGMRRRFSFLPAALISGAIFAVLHFEGDLTNVAVIFTVMIVSSLALSWAYEKTNSLWSAIGLHSALNSTMFLLIVLAQ